MASINNSFQRWSDEFSNKRKPLTEILSNEEAEFFREIGRQQAMKELMLRQQRSNKGKSNSLIGEDEEELLEQLEKQQRLEELTGSSEGDSKSNAGDSILPKAIKGGAKIGANILDKALSMYGVGNVKRAVDSGKLNDESKLVKGLLGIDNFVNRVADSATLNLRSEALGDEYTTGNKVADIGADILGYALPGTGAYKATRAIPKVGQALTRGAGDSFAKKAGKVALEGGIAGGVFSAGQSAVQEAGQNEYDLAHHLEQLAWNVGLGAGIDLGITGLSPVAKGLVKRIQGGEKITAKDIEKMPPEDVRILQEFMDSQSSVSRNASSPDSYMVRELEPSGTRGNQDTFDSIVRELEGRSTLESDINMAREVEMENLLQQQSSTREQRALDELENLWQETKQQKAEYKQLREELGKFKVPDDMIDDVPRSFRASKNSDAPAIEEIAEALGTTPEELALRLKELENINKLRKKDINADEQVEQGFQDEIDALDSKYENIVETNTQSYTESIEQLRQNFNDINTEFNATSRRTAEIDKTIEVINNGQEVPFNVLNSFPRSEQLRVARETASSKIEVESKIKNYIDEAEYKDAKEYVPEEEYTIPSGDAGDIKTFAQKEAEFREAYGSDEVSIREGFNKSFSEGMKKLAKTMIDELRPLKIAETAERGRGNAYVYKSATVEAGSMASSFNKISNELSPIFASLRKELGKDFNAEKDFLEYALARELVDEGLKGRKLPKGADLENSKAIVEKYEDSEIIQNAYKELRNFIDSHLDMLEPYYGADWVKQQRELKPDFFPLYRNLSEFDDFERSMFGGSGNSLKSRTDSGSELKIGNLVENLHNYSMNMHKFVARQRTASQVYELAQEGSKLAEIVPSNSEGKNIMTAMVDGKVRKIKLSDELAEPLLHRNSTVGEIDFATNVFMNMARLQRSGITLAPSFLTKEVLRNPPFAWITSRSGFTLKDYGKSIMATIFNKGEYVDLYEKMLTSGADMTTVYSQDLGRYKKAIERLEKGKSIKGIKSIVSPADWLDVLRDMSTLIDNTSKLAEYASTLNKGNTIKEGFFSLRNMEYSPSEARREIDALFNAREIFDYQMSGSTVRGLNRYSSFLNSSIRGKDKFYQAFKENPLRVMARSAIASAPPLALSYMGKHLWATDEQKRRMDEVGPMIKEAYILIPSPINDDIWTIPKPFEAYLAFGRGLEAVLDTLDDKTYDHSFADKTTAFLKRYLVYEPLTPINGFIDASFNKDSFTGQDIVQDYPTSPLPKDQIDTKVSEVALLISAMAGGGSSMLGMSEEDSWANFASPKKVDHLLKNMFPGLGQIPIGVVDLALKENQPNEKAMIINPTASFFNPVGKSLTMNDTGYSPTRQDFYDTSNRLKRQSSSDEDFLFDGVREELFTPVEKQLKELSDLRKEIVESPDYTPQEKQRAVDKLNAEMNEITRLLYDRGLTKPNNESELSRLELSLLGN